MNDIQLAALKSSGTVASGGPCWFVGANFDSTADQTKRFVRDGIWENGYEDKYLDLVREARAGQKIAIKASYTRKHGLPFDNRGHTVSVMAIKAIGTITENLGDGRHLRVDWQIVDPPREWYFYTSRRTIWKVSPNDWYSQGLIEFAFEYTPQAIQRFRNAPFWRERFGDSATDTRRFTWTKFYTAIADKLLEFRNRRDELVAGIHAIGNKVDCMSILNDQYQEGVPGGPLTDICPFTTLGTFNRGITDTNRKFIASELAQFLQVSEQVPNSFEGIPILNNQRTWFFGYSFRRQPDDIDRLWDVFARALELSDSDDTENRHGFIAAYDDVIERWGVGWNLTMGLYWIRPWTFPTLDSQSQRYISRKLDIPIVLNGPKNRCGGGDYLALRDTLETNFQDEAYPVHSFPELSLESWHFKEKSGSGNSEVTEQNKYSEANLENELEDDVVTNFPPSYSLENIINDGCFLEREKLQTILGRLKTKKNLILQGPPGTGKTWLARRLAFALIGQRDDSRVRAVQFHPNLSYEDFVRGWRPAGNGRLELVNGPFLETINAALKQPQSRYVIVIEEINRGSPAQIFGEMLTLLDVEKRSPHDALELSYRSTENERVFIPSNLYVIGTMNVADRSLALVDLALRRRFAFVELDPILGQSWRTWVHLKCGLSLKLANDIEQRISHLNNDIAADTTLGKQFRIGHSYVTPPAGAALEDEHKWFRDVVESEIGPLLAEYYFDTPSRAQQAIELLLRGL
jgi:5-methylcytosine-specific restriction protein B